VCGTVSLPFNAKESPVGEGNDVSPSRESQTQRATTGRAGILTIGPGERDPRCREDTLRAHISGLLLLLLENIMNGYGPLFLSRSYASKIASTTCREIDTPLC
jgi:hypothetical protein